LDRIRVAGLFGRSYARWGAVNVILYWVFFLALLTEIVTGGLLYFDYATGRWLTCIGSPCGRCWPVSWRTCSPIGNSAGPPSFFECSGRRPFSGAVPFDSAELVRALSRRPSSASRPKQEQHPATPVTTAPDVAD